MSTKKIVSPAQASGFVPETLRDAAYQGAHSAETLAACARFLRDIQPDVLEKGVTDENAKELKEGWQVRFNERNPADLYILKEGVYIKVADRKVKLPDGTVTAEFGVGLAMGLTSQEFGKLKGEDPNKHAIVKGWRESFSKYCSGRLAEMISILTKDAKAAELAANGGTVQRKTLNFTETLEKVLVELTKQRKNKQAKGDTTSPDEVKWRMACDALRKELNRKEEPKVEEKTE
jgi:hypothetical protein